MLIHLLIVALCLATPVYAAQQAQPARAWLLQLDGKVIDARRAEQALPPASLTKIMTALLWLQKPQQQDQIVTISTHAATAKGTRIGLKAGEQYLGSELLAAMLIASSNDACLALAEHAAGSERAFVAQMNQAARLLGLKATHFANACGHDAVNHTSSAHDLRLLAETALSLSAFRTLVAQDKWPLRHLDGSPGKVLESSNKLFGRLQGVSGVKTGYTAKAGPCLIAQAERDGHRVLLILLNSHERWWIAHRMIEQAFARAHR